MIFGSKKPKDKTVLIMDVESGSVGSSLARVSPGEAPKLFGERRVFFSVPSVRDSGALVRDVERAASETLAGVSEVAARLRNHPTTKHVGTIDSAALFFSAPWGMPNLREGKPQFLESLTRSLKGLLRSHAGEVPVSLHTHAGALVRGMNAIFEAKGPTLLCSMHGEVGELVLLDKGVVRGHSTIPLGVHSLIRTLKAHGALSEAEARSLFNLRTHPHQESLNASARHFRDLFREAGEPLLAGVPVEAVYVFSRGAEAEWFARALGHQSLADLFPHGGSVRTVRRTHLSPYVAAHAENPDVALLLCALFVDTH